MINLKKILFDLKLEKIAKISREFLLIFPKILNSFNLIKKNETSIQNFINLMKKNSSLFITHENGGGTTTFIENFVNNKNNCYILTNTTEKKSFVYKLYNFENKSFNIYVTKHQLKKIFDVKFDKIIINSLYTFSKWKLFQNYIIKAKNNFHITVEYMVHDFHCLCPSINLMKKDCFCNLNCSTNKCKFNLFLDYGISIKNWRNVWQNFLSNIDNIYCFSNSSKNLITKIYPPLESKIIVKPHSTDYCHFNKINFDNIPVKIAVIGNINNYAKGIKIVESLYYHLLKKNHTITLIGTEPDDFYAMIDKKCKINISGRYKSNELQNIIEKNRITHIVFPSVCPETFSYLISELIKLDIPIVGFDVGAQGEKLRNYKKGTVVNNLLEMYEYLDSLFIE